MKIFSLIIVAILTSCKAYDLDSNDNDWQPYQESDVLIFENSNGSIDTVIVNKSYISKIKTVEPYKIDKRVKSSNISFGKSNQKEIGLIRITKSKKETYLGLSEYTRFTRFGIDVPITEISKYVYEDKNYGNCYLFNELDKYRYGDDYKTKSILFSKKYGYLKFDFKDGSSVKLKEFIRNGENILR